MEEYQPTSAKDLQRIDTPIVTRLDKTCNFAPTEWEGRTELMGPIYIRFRWEKLSVKVGALPLDDNEPTLKLEIPNLRGDGNPSRLDEERMKQLLSNFITFEVDDE